MIGKVLKENEWKDERCFIVGGGPSLNGFDFSKLKDKGRIIAVNKSFYDVPFADVLIGMDTSFFRWADSGKLAKPPLGEKYRKAYREFKGHKIFIASRPTMIKNVHIIDRTKRMGLSKKFEDGIYTGNNSGVGALAFACIMGCNPIYLLGIDGKHKAKSHYHEGYPYRPQTSKTAKSFISHFQALGQEIKKAGIRVYNCSPISAVNTFPKRDIKEILNNENTQRVQAGWQENKS